MSQSEEAKSAYRVMVVVEESAARQMLSDLLRPVCDVTLMATGEDALIKLADRRADLIIIGETLYGTLSSGQLVREIQSFESDLPIFILTRRGESREASPMSGVKRHVSMVMLGSEASRLQLVLHIERAIAERARRQRDHMVQRRYRHAALSAGFFLVGPSAVAGELRDKAAGAAESNMNLMVTGETGVGKTLIAESVHHNGRRSSGPLVVTEPATLPPQLFAAELFGHTRGAFTGATSSQVGAFEAASGGTLVLDEIGDLAQGAQTQLLRAVETKTIRRIGDPREVRLDVRIVTATNRDLERDVDLGHFREDLFWRLNELRMHIPPLRERKEDIIPLLKHFLISFSGDADLECEVSDDVADFLMHHRWPGNVREIRTVARRMVHSGLTTRFTLADIQGLFTTRLGPADSDLSLDQRVKSLKRQLYMDEMAKYNFNVREAAKDLGIAYTTLRSRLKSMDLLDLVKDSRTKTDS